MKTIRFIKQVLLPLRPKPLRTVGKGPGTEIGLFHIKPWLKPVQLTLTVGKGLLTEFGKN